jgi:phage-related tail protein
MLARGGFVSKSGSYLVGERGPELVNLPGGSNVTPNHAMGNTIHVHINGRVGASDSEIRDIAKKVGAMVSREINRTTSSAVRM